MVGCSHSSISSFYFRYISPPPFPLPPPTWNSCLSEVIYWIVAESRFTENGKEMFEIRAACAAFLLQSPASQHWNWMMVWPWRSSLLPLAIHDTCDDGKQTALYKFFLRRHILPILLLVSCATATYAWYGICWRCWRGRWSSYFAFFTHVNWKSKENLFTTRNGMEMNGTGNRVAGISSDFTGSSSNGVLEKVS